MTVRLPDPAFDAWIERARQASVRGVLEARGAWRARMQGDSGNPCPGCGGHDRFAVNVKKNVWLCRRSGEGGDAIALVQHLDPGSSFLRACEVVTGEAPPSLAQAETQDERRARERAAEARLRERAAAAKREEEERALWRARERRAAWALWRRGAPLAGTPGEAYLALRGLVAMPGMRARFLADGKLWNRSVKEGGRIVHEGPALLLGIVGPDGLFAGVERIFIDLAQPKGKAVVVDPDSGALLASKKGRGAKKGGHVLVAAACAGADRVPATHIVAGEGFESVGSVWRALHDTGSDWFAGTEFRATLSIGNLAGPATARVAHPTETVTDAKGRVRRLRVDGAEPLADWPLMPVPHSVRTLTLLRDGDSDAFATGLALQRAGARYQAAYPWLDVRIADPGDGVDFNDLLMGSAA